MVDEAVSRHELSLEVVWTDEHMLELEALVVADHWGGKARAYTVPQDITRFASDLDGFYNGAATAQFVAGADDGGGLIALRLYRIDMAGHVACHIRMRSGKLSTGHRPEEAFRLELEVRTEAWQVGRFARHLAELGRTQAGRAELMLVRST